MKMTEGESKAKKMKIKRKREDEPLEAVSVAGKNGSPKKAKREKEEKTKNQEAPAKKRKDKNKKKKPKNKVKSAEGDDKPKTKNRRSRKALRNKRGAKLFNSEDAINLRTDPELLKIHEKRLKKRDERTLFFAKNSKLTEEKIKANLTGFVSIRKIVNSVYVMFTNREAAKCAYKQILEDKIFDEEKVAVDFVGKKQAKEENIQPLIVDKRGLFITDLPKEEGVASEDIRKQLTKLFPKVQNIRLQRRPNFSIANFAILRFGTAEEAREAFLNSDKATLNGCGITVLYSMMKEAKEALPDGQEAPPKKKKNKRKPKAKKPKVAQENESETVQTTGDQKPKVLLAKKKKAKVNDVKKPDLVLLAKKKKKEKKDKMR